MILSEYLYIKLNQLKQDLGLDELEIKCYDEREFANAKIGENELSVITKKMVPTLTFNTVTTPYQIYVLTEQNSIERTQELLNRFSLDNNWTTIQEGTTYTKIQLSQPMAMNNFEIVGCGYRSALYISATTFELKNVIDLKNLKVNGESITIVGASIGYGANMDTIQYATHDLSNSVKTGGALSLSLIIPSTNTQLNIDALKIMFGDTSISGNKDFNFEFDIGNIHVGDENNPLPMKISEVSFSTAVNDIPSINIVFVR